MRPWLTSAVPIPVSAQNPLATSSQCRFQFSNYNDLVNHEDHYQAYAEINFEFAPGHKFHGEVGWNRFKIERVECDSVAGP